MTEKDGFPTYNFLDDLKRLGATAIKFIRPKVEPIVEEEIYPGQLFVGDTVVPLEDEPTIEMDINEINAHLWGNTYTHPFDHHPDRIEIQQRFDEQ